MTDLILTEKFSVAQDFARALGVKKKGDGCFEGAGFVITWAVGHLVALKDPEDYGAEYKKWRLETLPLVPKTFEYKPIGKTYKQFKIIRTLLIKRSFQRVIIATDAGREGEVIARTILLKAGFLDKARIFRFWTSQALVPAVVKKTMEKLKPISAYDRLWQAGSHRQAADWLIGMNGTRVLTVRLGDLFSVGRVQTAVLALLADRKQERDDFVPEAYWLLKARFFNEKGNWEGLWFKGKESKIPSVEKARSLMAELEAANAPGQVVALERERKKESPPLLFSLTDLQREANKRFGFPAKKTLGLAQTLYQDRKCLSYPRTDARVLGTENLSMVKGIMDKLTTVHPDLFQGVESGRLSLSNRRVFNDARLTDHHALIPLKPLPPSSGSDERRIFDLVLRRFAAAFHGDCEFERTRVVTALGGEQFVSRGKVVLAPGWQRVWSVKSPKSPGESQLPPLEKGDPAQVRGLKLEEKKTQPPPAYTDALLLKDMTNPGRYVGEDALKKFYRGEVGLGTQSTRAQIMETLISRRYVNRVGKTLEVTPKGSYLVTVLRKCPVSRVLTSPEETARWEMALNRISLGESRDLDFLDRIKDFISRSVAELKAVDFGERPAGGLKMESPALGNCPACGADVKENRKAYGCSNGECKFVIWKTMARKKISPHMATNLLKYGKSGPFKGFYSKKKKPFRAGLVIQEKDGQWQVEFDFSKGKKTPAAAPASVLSGTLALACPLCGGELIEGKTGVGCSRWRPADGDCRFVIWKTVAGKKLTEKNLETLLQGKTTRPYVLRDDRGEKYKAALKLLPASRGQAWIEILPREGGPSNPERIPCFR